MSDSNDQTETVLTEARTQIKPGNASHGVGSTLKDRFVLEEEIGRGGMGVVYRALDLRKKETEDREPYVAIKLISSEVKQLRESLIALQREAKKAQKLAHPNVATVYDFDRDGDEAYLCMELLQGEPLSDLLKRYVNRGMTFAEALPIIQGMARGLGYAHQENIVHSDFKPGNVFVTKKGSVKILDFGIARAFTPENQSKDQTVFDPGDWDAITPSYASPEMFLRQDPDPRDDIYALGCVCYQLLIGRHPYDKTTAIKAINSNLKPPVIKSVSREINTVLQKSVALDRDKRISSIEEFLEGITPKKKQTNYWPVVVGCIAVVCAVLAGWYLLNQSKEIKATIAVAEGNIWRSQEQPVDAETESKINRLFEIADAHMSVGRYIEPATSNAAETYTAILTLQPGNSVAIEKANAIAQAVLNKVDRLTANGDIDEAERLLDEALTVLPEHPLLEPRRLNKR